MPAYTCVLTTSGTVLRYAAMRDAASLEVSSVVPSGKSSMTWNSLLLSNGSIFTCTALNPTRLTLTSSSAMMPA